MGLYYMTVCNVSLPYCVITHHWCIRSAQVFHVLISGLLLAVNQWRITSCARCCVPAVLIIMLIQSTLINVIHIQFSGIYTTVTSRRHSRTSHHVYAGFQVLVFYSLKPTWCFLRATVSISVTASEQTDVEEREHTRTHDVCSVSDNSLEEAPKNASWVIFKGSPDHAWLFRTSWSMWKVSFSPTGFQPAFRLWPFQMQLKAVTWRNSIDYNRNSYKSHTLTNMLLKAARTFLSASFKKVLHVQTLRSNDVLLKTENQQKWQHVYYYCTFHPQKRFLG